MADLIKISRYLLYDEGSIDFLFPKYVLTYAFTKMLVLPSISNFFLIGMWYFTTPLQKNIGGIIPKA
jgi:hypothetical protein